MRGLWWPQQKCPTCRSLFSVEESYAVIVGDGYDIQFEAYVCPECAQHIIYATVPEFVRVYRPARENADFGRLVPPSLFRDFQEARNIIDASPNASAMLSRHCLQRLLRGHFGVPEGNLDSEIRAVLKSASLPAFLAEDLDAVREVGNFAAGSSVEE